MACLRRCGVTAMLSDVTSLGLDLATYAGVALAVVVTWSLVEWMW